MPEGAVYTLRRDRLADGVETTVYVVRYRRDYLVEVLLRQFEMVAELPAAATDGQNFYVLKVRRL